MMSDKFVSVIMNCYNGEKYLQEAIESVLAQTHENWELIFWDNQSNDSSAQIFKSYKDSRLKYHYSDKHEVVISKARNQAISKSKGDFVSFLDVDDKWLPIKLTVQLQIFAEQDVGIVCGNYWLCNERRGRNSLAIRQNFESKMATNELLKSYFVALVTLVIRRDILEKLEYLFDDRYHIIGDFDLVIRLSMESKLGYVNKPVAVLRLHENNETNKNIAIHLNELNSWIEAAENIKAIRVLDGFKYRKNWYVYTKALYKIIEGEKKYSYVLFKKLPWGIWKFRLLLALLMPTIIVRALKN